MVADRFVLLQQVAQQKSATEVDVCHQSKANKVDEMMRIILSAVSYNARIANEGNQLIYLNQA